MYVLTIDIGTTGGKVLLFSEALELRQSYRADYPTYHNGTDDQAEHDPADWWQVCRSGIRQVLDAEGISGREVRCIGLSCMTPVLLPVDRAGRPLTRAWLWCDRRASGTFRHMAEAYPMDRLETLCGSRCKAISFLPKLLQFRQSCPELYADTAAFLQANGYLILRLTGRWTLDTSHEELLHLCDLRTGAFSPELLDLFQIPREKFPELVPTGAVAGCVTAEAARETGLAEGTPVISGGHDSALSAYAFGLDQAGRACLDIGNAANLIMALDRPVRCPAADVYRHPVPGVWLFQIYNSTVGAAFRWFRNVFGGEELRQAQQSGRSAYDLLCDLAAQSPPGANGLLFYPYLEGAQQCTELRGAFENIRLHHGRADFARALLEGCACSVRYNRDQMEAASGARIEHLTACGGGSRNAFWLQIYADVLGCPIYADEIAEAASTGAARLALTAVGSPPPARSADGLRRIDPNPLWSDRYAAVSGEFRRGLENQIAYRTSGI